MGKVKYQYDVIKQDIVKAVTELYEQHGKGNCVTLDTIKLEMTNKLPKSTLSRFIDLCVDEGLIRRTKFMSMSKRESPLYSYRPLNF